VQIDLRKGDVAAAKAALGQAQATLNTARANLRQVEVKQGDVAGAIASMNQAAATLKTAQANSVQVGIKKGDVESAIAAMRQSEAALQSTQTNRLTVAAKQQNVISARAALVRDQVTAHNALQNLQQTRVVAPRDGMVLQKYVDVGAIIQSGQSGFSGGTAIVQLAQVNRMYVDVMVDEADIAQVKVGQKVDVVLDAYPDTHKVGTVRKIYPLAAVDQNVTYIHVQVELNPKDVNRDLRPLMNATCDFLVQQKNNVVTVPADAVKDEAGYSTVTVIKDPSQPHWEPDNQEVRKVQVGVRGNDDDEILSGVKAGDLVVTQVIQPVPDGGGAPGGTRSLTGGRGGGGGRRGR
jgi:HlyD family secretion protein